MSVVDFSLSGFFVATLVDVSSASLSELDDDDDEPELEESDEDEEDEPDEEEDDDDDEPLDEEPEELPLDDDDAFLLELLGRAGFATAAFNVVALKFDDAELFKPDAEDVATVAIADTGLAELPTFG